MKARPAAAIVFALVLVGFALGPAAAHGPGSAVITANGTFELTPTSTANDTYHGYLSDLGLPIDAGDTLRFAWTTNSGLGPAVFFEIHSHPGETGFRAFYERTAIRDDNSWSVPETDRYMVLWSNANDGTVNVSYAFQLLPPPPALWPLYILGIGVASTAVALWLLGRRRDKK